MQLIFEEGTESYWARQRVQEKLAGLDLPEAAKPDLGPLATAYGEIYRYELVTDGTQDLMELRTLNDWVVIPRLLRAPGVADVSNFGGCAKQFAVTLQPAQLDRYGLSLNDVVDAVKATTPPPAAASCRRGSMSFVIDAADLKLLSLYGTNPVFVFDPENKSNRPVPGWHKNAIALWPLYPSFFRDLFVRAFTLGLRDAWARVRESEWRVEWCACATSAYCAVCGAENFYDPDVGHQGNVDAPRACWRCSSPLVSPPRLHLNGGATAKTVVLNQDTRLYPHHMGEFGNYDFSQAQPRLWSIQRDRASMG